MQTVGFGELQVFLVVSSNTLRFSRAGDLQFIVGKAAKNSVILQVTVFIRENFPVNHVVNHISQVSCLQSMCKCLILGKTNLTGNKGHKERAELIFI